MMTSGVLQMSILESTICPRSGRVLKLHRGFILTKKGDINPQKNLETPLAPWGAFLGFLI
jgi:hypothetical protein